MTDSQTNPTKAAGGGRSTRTALLALAVVAVLAVGAFGIWFLFFRSSGPPPVGSSGAVIPSSAPAASAATSGTTASAGATADPTTSAGSSGSVSDTTDGTWTVDTSIGSFSDFSGSFVGDRVQEQLATIGANTAVGRTPDVSGSLTLQGSTVTAAEITADLSTLQSDDGRRDGQLHRQAIQTDQFPTATFKLTQPIDLGSVPADGATVSVTATGDLTLHGVTKSVQIPLTITRSGDVVGVTGSLDIQFADYDIAQPNSFMVLSIDDHGTMELQVFFRHG